MSHSIFLSGTGPFNFNTGSGPNLQFGHVIDRLRTAGESYSNQFIFTDRHRWFQKIARMGVRTLKREGLSPKIAKYGGEKSVIEAWSSMQYKDRSSGWTLVHKHRGSFCHAYDKLETGNWRQIEDWKLETNWRLETGDKLETNLACEGHQPLS